MNSETISSAQRVLLIIGRALLGLYFVVPGITKIFQFGDMSAYMAMHGVPLVPVLLGRTSRRQGGGGSALASGYRSQLMALLLGDRKGHRQRAIGRPSIAQITRVTPGQCS